MNNKYTIQQLKTQKRLVDTNPKKVLESMHIDDDDGNSVIEVRKSFSVPDILRKVFTDAFGDDDDDGLLDNKLFGIAVCAVQLVRMCFKIIKE